jgi:hypothetical protein
MPKLHNLLKYCDLFGEGVMLNVKGENKIKTIFGACLTIITAGLLAGATWLMGKDMVYKEQPFTSIQEVLYTYRPFYNLDRDTFPIAFCVQRYDQTVWDIKKYFRMEVLNWKAFNPNTSSLYYTYEYENCTREHFPKLDADYLSTANVKNYYCLKNQNITIGGYWDNEFVQYAIFRVRRCNNITDGGCAPAEEIDLFFKDHMTAFNLYVQQTVIDPRNLTNPEQIYLLNLFKNIKITVRKSFDIYIRDQELFSDEGFIFEHRTPYYSLAYDSSDQDETNPSSESIMDINLFVSHHKLNYYRSYIKIQTVLANFGGISDALFLIISMVAVYFCQNHLHQKLMNKIFDFNFDENIKIISGRRVSVANVLGLNVEELERKFSKEKDLSHNKAREDQKVHWEDNSQSIINPDHNMSHLDKQANTKSPFEIELKNDDEGGYRNEVNLNFAQINETGKNVNLPRAKTKKESVPTVQTLSASEKKSSITKIIDSVKKKYTERKLKLSFCETLMKPCCRGTATKQVRMKYNLFDKASKALIEYMDITKIVHQLDEYQKFKVTLLNCEQLAMFQFISKDICTLEEQVKLNSEITRMKAFVNNKEQMVEMLIDYKSKIDNSGNPITPLDKKLFEMIDADVKKMI